jgi:NAD(P)-dependent dehydrogenase (short-subunit alcohol dehydrogenase family)
VKRRTTDIEGDVMRTPHGGVLAAFFCAVSCSSALTAGVALLLYTGEGFLKTVGILLGIAIGAVAAGLWAGDESSRSTRARLAVNIAVLLVACVFAARWSTSENLRAHAVGGSLAVLFVLALPGYAAGATFAAIERHRTSDDPVTQALFGAAIGCVLTTVLLVPRVDAWGVYFVAASLLIPSAVFPAASGNRTSPFSFGGTMRDRVVIITGVGAVGQVGYAVARAFAAQNARLILVGHTDAVRGLADQLGPRSNVIGVVADLTTEDGVARVIEAARGLGRLDALVNVAGGLTVIDTIEDTTPDEFRREMSINAGTVLLMSRAALPMLRESRGAIVNFASPAGEHASAKLGAYSAAKAAVIALTRSLALEELEHGVRVNAIAPGMIDTEQNRASASPGQKYVSREEIADVVLFLTGETSRGVSGEVVHVAGATLS